MKCAVQISLSRGNVKTINSVTESMSLCACGTFSVEHSIEEVLGLSLQPTDPRLLLFEVFTL